MRLRFQSRSRFLFTTCAILPALAAHGALAQQMSRGLEEIVVTATKRSAQSIQEIPISVQAVSGAELQRRGALDFNDYYRQIPSLTVNDQGPGNKQYNIRGINSSGAGTVGLYFDEVIITNDNLSGDGGRAPDLKLFDMDRIEVLRGPQGTTFGSSSLSGTIRWLPNQPVLDAWQADAGGRLEKTKESVGWGWTADAMVNMPLVRDKLAVRLSGIIVDKAGYIDNRYIKDANTEKTEAGRAQILWQATDELRISALAMKQDMKTGAKDFYNAEDFSLAQSPTLNGGPLPTRYFAADPARGGFIDDTKLYNAKVTYEKEWGSFTVTSSLMDRYTEDRRPTSAAGEILSGGLLAADSTGRSRLETTKDRKVWSHEARFASSWNSPFQILVGGFLQRDKADQGTEFITLGPNGQRGPDSVSLLYNELYSTRKEKAVFGEASWDITPALTLTGGARWFDFDIKNQGNVITNFMAQPGPGLGDEYGSKENGVIFKGNLSYRFSDDFLAYAQVAEGYRPGGANDQGPESIVGVPIPDGYQSDSIINYELGFKSSWFDNALIVNAAAFIIDWTDIQIRRQAVNPDTGVQYAYRSNGGAAKVKGVELEVTAQPVAELRIGGNFAYTDSKLTEDLPILTDGQRGDRIPYIPKVTAGVNAHYERPVADGINAFLGADWSYTGSSRNRLRPTDRYYRVHQSHMMTNLRAGVSGEDWSLTLAVDNVFDTDRTIFYAFDFQGPPPPGGFVPDNLVRPWPRTFSLSIRKSFH